MHDGVVSKDPAHLRTRQRVEDWNRILNSGPKPGPLRLTAVRRLQHKPRRMGTHPVARFFEARDGLTRAPGEAKKVTDPPDQRRFQHDRKIGGQLHRTARGACDGPY